jgi:hypothetical protein
MKANDNRNVVIYVLVAFFTSVIFTGCESNPSHIHAYQTYWGPPLPIEQVAILKIGGSPPFGNDWVQPVKIDAQDFSLKKIYYDEWAESHHDPERVAAIQLLPGQHTIKFVPSQRDQNAGFSASPITIDLYVKAGKTYTAKGVFYDMNTTYEDTSYRNYTRIQKGKWRVDIKEE